MSSPQSSGKKKCKLYNLFIFHKQQLWLGKDKWNIFYYIYSGKQGSSCGVFIGGQEGSTSGQLMGMGYPSCESSGVSGLFNLLMLTVSIMYYYISIKVYCQLQSLHHFNKGKLQSNKLQNNTIF